MSAPVPPSDAEVDALIAAIRTEARAITSRFGLAEHQATRVLHEAILVAFLETGAPDDRRAVALRTITARARELAPVASLAGADEEEHGTVH